MTIAGSDSGGGAGIQADLRTFNAFGVFGTSAITALTAQNPFEVSMVEAVSPEMVSAQIRTVLNSVRISAFKTGMLFSKNIIEAVADSLSGNTAALVCDPVMISTSGVKLLRDDAVESLKNRLLPISSWITPNIPEAEVLTSMKIGNESGMISAARLCHEKWGASVIIKGGHSAEKDFAIDIICVKGKVTRLSTRRIKVEKNSDHGTGCTFSAALAAGLASWLGWEDAIVSAKAFVTASLASTVNIGNDSCTGLSAMFPPGSFEKYKKSVFMEKI